MKQPYIWWAITFYLRNPPKDHLGVIRDNWNCGKNEPVPLGKLIHDTAMIAASFAIDSDGLTADETNAQLRIAAKTIIESVDRIEAKRKEEHWPPIPSPLPPPKSAT